MLSKIPQPILITVIVLVAVTAVTLAILHVRHVTGADLTDQMHAYMKQQKPGQAPFTQQQMQQMNAQHGR